MSVGRRNRLIGTFLRHPVAANLLMFAMILLGVYSLTRINTQFLPNFSFNFINISVSWSGASAEDVQRSVITPIEQELRSVDYVKEMTSSSQLGFGQIRLEFFQGTDMNRAMEQVKEGVSVVRNLPEDSEAPVISKQEHFEPIARLILSGGKQLSELRQLAYYIEQILLDNGIAKVTIEGLPDLMIAIRIPLATLLDVQLSLGSIAERIAKRSGDLPAGTIGKNTTRQQLRSLQQRRSAYHFEDLTLVSDPQGRRLRLADIAEVDMRPQDDEVIATYQGKPAVELTVFRTETADALGAAANMQHVLASLQPNLPKGVSLHVYDESWKLIKDRILLLLKNGLGGLLLILVLLFIALNKRVAFWVAMGIPVSVLATYGILFFLGGSVNMITLFATIMALGIIVDDTIVVGEEALSQLNNGKEPAQAVELATRKMLAPVLASSLTTIAAFIPLLLIGDIIGKILSAIPVVIICVIIASVIECFLVLPGHLYHSFKKIDISKQSPLRLKIDGKFFYFREHLYRRFVTRAIQHRWITLSAALCLMCVVIGLVVGGRIHFTFFPSPESSMIHANVQFTAGTSPRVAGQFIRHLETTLKETNEQLSSEGASLVETSIAFQNKGAQERGLGSNLASVNVELLPPDRRVIRNKDFIQAWRSRIQLNPNVENLIISAPRAGPPGQDIDVLLEGNDSTQLKQAALELASELKKYQGVTDIEDDLPYGQIQAIFELTPQGKVLDLTIDEVARQLRAAFTGNLAQIYHEGKDEIEVRVMLPDAERYSLMTLEQLPIITPDKEVVPLSSVVSIKSRRGFDILRNTDTKLTVHVLAEVDETVTNANSILQSLEKRLLPRLVEKYGLSYQLEGKAEEQAMTLRDMRYGVILAFFMIYIILSWVFSSYGWPFIVMAAIPFGLIGAIAGHWLLGYDLTILSLLGFFGLSGIVINDSIILITAYKRLRAAADSTREAIVSASCERLRAVLLTSLTTIAGLTPLLFETSLQAQFLIPMAISISFGLAFSTVLILIVIPALLSIYEDVYAKLGA